MFWDYCKAVSLKLGDERILKYISVVYAFFSSNRAVFDCADFIANKIEGPGYKKDGN